VPSSGPGLPYPGNRARSPLRQGRPVNSRLDGVQAAILIFSELSGSFDEDEKFRSTIDKRRCRFGEGEYEQSHARCQGPIEQGSAGLLSAAGRARERLGRAAGDPDGFPAELESAPSQCCSCGVGEAVAPRVSIQPSGGALDVDPEGQRDAAAAGSETHRR
jgi:hypothetical protein